MGVISCDRRGCNNIMCSRYSHKYGNLCSECFEELVESYRKDIQKFMDSDKKDKAENTRTYHYYDDIFPLRD